MGLLLMLNKMLLDKLRSGNSVTDDVRDACTAQYESQQQQLQQLSIVVNGRPTPLMLGNAV